MVTQHNFGMVIIQKLRHMQNVIEIVQVLKIMTPFHQHGNKRVRFFLALFNLYRKVVIKLDHMEERVTRLEVKMENIEEKDKVTQSHLKKLRDNVDRNEKLVNELQNVCNTLNILIDELRSDRERERNTRNKYVFWFLTTVFTVLITALLTLIII